MNSTRKKPSEEEKAKEGRADVRQQHRRQIPTSKAEIEMMTSCEERGKECKEVSECITDMEIQRRCLGTLPVGGVGTGG
jgi:hypothetical protein